jgi:hypothetical protein
VTGPLTPGRQRRRRITPNTSTTTTTMISTHNHVDMAASLVGAGAIRGDATAAHPSKQLGHRQATSQARIDGRAGSRGPRGGLSGSSHAQPAKPPTRRTRQASTDPKQPQRARPGGLARPRRGSPAWVGDNASMGCADARWQTPRRRRRTDGARLRRNPNLMVSHLMLDRVGLGGWSTPSRAGVDDLGRP